MSLQSISSEIATNVQVIRQQISEAARASGRDPAEVRLIAVSKRKPAAMIRAAFAAGVKDFGENYVQEAVPKIQSLNDLAVVWHFIGAIQSNKTRLVAEYFHWVHTVAEVKTARRLSQQCPAGKTLDVCVQVNIDQDPHKAGVAPEDVRDLLNAIQPLPNLRIRGLMSVLQQDSDPARSYRNLARLFERMRQTGSDHWDTLSMGMSGDFRAAISAGATHVRIGSAIFGARE